MSAVLFKFVCATCGTVFYASGAPEMSYGEFVLRSEYDEEVYLEAITNDVFKEVARMVRAHPLLARYDQLTSGDIAQKVFGYVCDYSSRGKRFHIELNPSCPSCSSRDMASREEVYPQKLTNLVMATQNRWVSLSEDQKSKIIDTAVKEALN